MHRGAGSVLRAGARTPRRGVAPTAGPHPEPPSPARDPSLRQQTPQSGWYQGAKTGREGYPHRHALSRPRRRVELRTSAHQRGRRWRAVARALPEGPRPSGRAGGRGRNGAPEGGTAAGGGGGAGPRAGGPVALRPAVRVRHGGGPGRRQPRRGAGDGACRERDAAGGAARRGGGGTDVPGGAALGRAAGRSDGAAGHRWGFTGGRFRPRRPAGLRVLPAPGGGTADPRVPARQGQTRPRGAA